jgi:formylglycine-generating enzyme
MVSRVKSLAALAVFIVAFSVIPAQADTISIATVPVGDAGNLADTTSFGAVGYNYQMGKCDVTNDQYAAFLTAKAASSDPYGLWNGSMQSDANGGINRAGSGPFTYTVKPNQGSQPVVDVSWYDAVRFANWLTNGQGTVASTETGSYTLLGGTPTPSNSATISRNPGAQWVLPSEDEWYKAAYYKGGGTNAGYWSYPTRSDTAPVWVLSTVTGPNGGANSANFFLYTNGYSLTGSTSYVSTTDYLTNVGAYPGALGPYGTLDQGGEVWQWNETLISISGSFRGLRGGSWQYPMGTVGFVASSYRYNDDPAVEEFIDGFRLANVPEPGTTTLLVVGAIAGLLCWRRWR